MFLPFLSAAPHSSIKWVNKDAAWGVGWRECKAEAYSRQPRRRERARRATKTKMNEQSEPDEPGVGTGFWHARGAPASKKKKGKHCRVEWAPRVDGALTMMSAAARDSILTPPPAMSDGDWGTQPAPRDSNRPPARTHASRRAAQARCRDNDLPSFESDRFLRIERTRARARSGSPHLALHGNSASTAY